MGIIISKNKILSLQSKIKKLSLQRKTTIENIDNIDNILPIQLEKVDNTLSIELEKLDNILSIPEGFPRATTYPLSTSEYKEYIKNTSHSYNNILDNYIINNDFNNNEILFIINDKYIISDINDNIKLLKYNKLELINTSILNLLSHYIYYIHNNIFLNSINIKLINEIHNNKIIYIYDKNKNKYIAKLNIDILFNNLFIVKIYLKKNIINNNDINIYNNINLLNNNIYKETNLDIIIIYIDFINSTKLLNNNNISFIININNFFYNKIIEIIKLYYYSYIYIYEIIGDCFVLVVNKSNYCTTLAIDFINKLYNKTINIISFKVGIIYDKLYYCKINNNLRYFGRGINLAARLESIGIENNILVSEKFYNKLITENIFNLLYETKMHNFKGFENNIIYYIINLINNKTNLNLFN